MKKADFADRFKTKMEAKNEARESKLKEEPKPETVAKVQRTFLIIGSVITILALVGWLITCAT